MSQQTVSVALCTYNGAAYVLEQLESIAAQTRSVDEVVVCDDGSTDATLEIIQRFADSRDCPFGARVFRNQPQRGVTLNFARAIGECRGAFIFLADQDDVWCSTKVEKLCALMEADASCALAFCDADICDAALKPSGDGLFDAVWFTPDEQDKVRQGRAIDVFARHAIAAGTTLGFRASFRDLILPIPNLRTAHDIWTSTLIACVSPIAFTTERLVKYRVHGQNQVGMRRWNLLEQIAKAREQLQLGAFAHAVDLYSEMARRLREVQIATRFTPRPGALRLLDEKVAHCRLRNDMPPGLLSLPRRLPGVVRELLRGNYTHYSYGVKSVLQDLFLR